MSLKHPHVGAVETYLQCLRDQRFDDAAAQFTEDAHYLHPPTFQDEVKEAGRENIRQYFVDSRGHATSTTASNGLSSTAIRVQSMGE